MSRRPNLNAYLRRWQKTLGLLHWDIEVQWLAKDEPVAKSYACVYTDVHNRVARAKITPLERIQSPDVGGVHPQDRLVVFNAEHSVLHELLHVQCYEYGIGPLGDSDMEGILFERFINVTADALLEVQATKPPKE